MSYGLSPTGFKQKRLPEILDDLHAALRAEFGEIGTGADQVFGQLSGVIASPIADLWEELAGVWASQYRNGAEGVSLDGVAAYLGLTRITAAKSTVPVVFGGDLGTVVPVGTQVRLVNQGAVLETTANVTISNASVVKAVVTVEYQEDTVYYITINGITVNHYNGNSPAETVAAGIQSAILSNVTIAAAVSVTRSGAVLTIGSLSPTTSFTISDDDYGLTVNTAFSQVLAQAVVAGRTIIPAGAVAEIVTPVSGVESVTNLVDGNPGRDLETDDAFRTRIIAFPNVSGRATENAIKSRVFALVTGVTSVAVISNRTLVTDIEGRPAKSFEVIVASPGEDDNAIAQAIYDAMPAGILPVSTATVPSSGTATDVNGNPVTIAFSRPTPVRVWLWIDLTLNPEQAFPANGVSLVRDNVLALGNQAAGGEDVIVQRFYGPIFAVPGVATATLYIATGETEPAKPGTPAANIVIPATGIASYDDNQIFVEVVP